MQVHCTADISIGTNIHAMIMCNIKMRNLIAHGTISQLSELVRGGLIDDQTIVRRRRIRFMNFPYKF